MAERSLVQEAEGLNLEATRPGTAALTRIVNGLRFISRQLALPEITRKGERRVIREGVSATSS